MIQLSSASWELVSEYMISLVNESFANVINDSESLQGWPLMSDF